MALIRYAEGQQRSGSIGATVYSHNRYGAYVRARSVPVNPNTDRQVAIRNAVRGLTIAWGTVLDQAQRDAWNAYAAEISWTNKLGDSVNLTGLNHYVRSNSLRITVDGHPRIDDAPTWPYLAVAEQDLSAVASEASQDLTTNGDPDGAWIADPGSAQFYFMGRPQSAAIKFFAGPFRYFGTAAIGPPPFPFVAAAPWPIAEGQRIWLRSRVQRSDGRLSEFAQINFLCAA